MGSPIAPGLPGWAPTRKATASFSPASIAGLQGWYKADAITGKNDGDALSSWADSSAAAHNLSQATGANQPLYKTNIINGKPAVRFDGVNDFLASASGLGPYATTTIFVVTKTGVISSGTHAVAGAEQIFYAAGGFKLFAGAVLASGVGADATSYYLTAQFNGASSKLRVSGAQTSGDAGTTALTQLTVGSSSAGGNPWSGDIAEAIFYSGVLSAANITAVEAYLKAKYGL